MAYLNYHPQNNKAEQAPRLELVAEGGESVDDVKTAMLHNLLQIIADDVHISNGSLLEPMELEGDNLKERLSSALGQLTIFKDASPSDLPIRPALAVYEMELPVVDARTGQPLEEVRAQDGTMIQTPFGFNEQERREAEQSHSMPA